MESIKGALKAAAIIGGLATWYTFTSPSQSQLEKKLEYQLPQEISVVETSLPFKTKGRVWTSENKDGTMKEKQELEKIVKTDDIDFSGDFSIETDRYTLVKGDDWLPSRILGHVASLPTKLYFWDWNAGIGLDEDRTRAVLSMLENNENIKDLTVRINHNEPIYDCYRLFGDENVAERNNFFARALLGVPSSIFGELFSELRRGDYYNPMNQTAVLYSNIESVSAHEIGHHQDFQRFDSDWEYSMARAFPPATLYQEWQASQNAKGSLESSDKWQFNRYLLPAFFTYLLAGYALSKRVLKVRDDDDETPNSFQTLRHFGTRNLDLYGGIMAHNFSESLGAWEPLNYAAFTGGFIATELIADAVLKRIIPYNHEE